MHEVMTAFPNVTALRAASPAELGLVALRGFARMSGVPGGFAHATSSYRPSRKDLIAEILNGLASMQQDAQVAAEAVAWLVIHGLLAETYDTLNTGWLFITRLGREVVKTNGATPGGVAIALRVMDLLPPEIRTKITPSLLAGDFDLAVIAACKAVEIRMRERTGLSSHDSGRRLAKKFFERVSSTSLQRTDRPGVLKDEEHLFEGIFGLYRDRAAHEAPHIDSAEYALEVVVAAAHLLRIVDAAELVEASA